MDTGIGSNSYAIIALNEDRQNVFYQPVSESALNSVLPALWQYLDALHPVMWRRGETMLRQASQLQRLMGTGELSIAFSNTIA